MSDIKVGDLVYVAFPFRCGCHPFAGNIFTVTGFHVYPAGYPWLCRSCRATGTLESSRQDAIGHVAGTMALSLLRRIPPLSELESTERKEEQPA